MIGRSSHAAKTTQEFVAAYQRADRIPGPAPAVKKIRASLAEKVFCFLYGISLAFPYG
jgi:hypothetical protein